MDIKHTEDRTAVLGVIDISRELMRNIEALTKLSVRLKEQNLPLEHILSAVATLSVLNGRFQKSIYEYTMAIHGVEESVPVKPATTVHAALGKEVVFHQETETEHKINTYKQKIEELAEQVKKNGSEKATASVLRQIAIYKGHLTRLDKPKPSDKQETERWNNSKFQAK